MRNSSVAGLLAAIVILSPAGGSLAAHEYKVGGLVVVHPWARATPGGAEVGGGYLTISNTGQASDRLLGGSLEAAANTELHGMSTQNGVMTMRATGPLEIPAGGSLTLDPAGTHLMFTGLKHGLKKGDSIPGTLVFDKAGTVPVTFKVEGIGAKAPAKDGGSGHSGHSMPGMDMD